MWNGAWPQAIADWTRVIELKPSYAPPYFLRAELRRQKGDWKTSVPDYQRAIDLTVKEGRDRPDWLWVAYLNLGCCLLNTGKYQEAIANFDKSLELCPDEALTFDARSEANLELGRWEKSISDASKAVELAPDKVESYVTRGVAQMALKRYDAALADFTKSIALAPDDAMHYYDRGLCHYHKGEYTKARPDFEKALTLNITEDRATWIRKWLLATAPQPSREAPPAAQGKTIRIGNAARSSLIVKPTATTRPASGGNQSTRPMVTTPVETTTQAAATTRPAQPSSEAREWIGESNRQIGATSWYVYGLAGAGVAAVCVVVGVLVMRRSRERGSKGA